MACSDLTNAQIPCQTFQIIEPDQSSLVATGFGSFTDPSLFENGSFILNEGDTRAYVPFLTTKASDNYFFQYLYVEADGIPNPGNISTVVVNKTIFGFTIDLAGSPIGAGYILQWQVVVQSLLSSDTVDLPESLRVQLPQAEIATITFVNSRSSTNYGFTELRVENLIDPAATQRAIIAQVVAKTLSDFTVGLNPPPETSNYFLCVRTP